MKMRKSGTLRKMHSRVENPVQYGISLDEKQVPLNPLIGSAGVSAVPMAARVVSKVGNEEDSSNVLLMHAMGPNVSGVVGSAVAAGVLISIFA